jgi:competence protein CoiA
MLSAKRKSDGQTVLAYFGRKSDAPFVCRDCGEEVRLHQGSKRVDHFAHVNPIACTFATAESDEHRRCKMEIFEALQREAGVRNVALERTFGPIRPDVSAVIRGVPVAIEVQISALSMEAIIKRTIWYARKGIYVLWLLPSTAELENSRYAPRSWERWIHAAYFGSVFYWLNGLNVVSYHFEPCLKSVQEMSYDSRNGKRMRAGGFTRRMKRYRKPVRGKTLHLVNDFGPQERLWWEGGGIKVPDAKLFTARLGE